MFNLDAPCPIIIPEFHMAGGAFSDADRGLKHESATLTLAERFPLSHALPAPGNWCWPRL